MSAASLTLKQKYYRAKHKAGRIILPNSPSSSSVPFGEYIKWFAYTRFTPEYPYAIDIQTKSGCNAHCSFCPVGKEENKIYGSMSQELFEKIVDEVIEYPVLFKIDPYLLNDPLVDKKMPERVQYIAQKKDKRRFPKVRITTNAGLLSEEMGYRLLQTEGLDEINFSFHTIIPDVYEKMMSPLKFDRVMGNILSFKEQWDNFKGKKPTLTIWTVKTRPVIENLKNEMAYWKKVGIGFKARKLDNRANTDIETQGFEDREFTRVPFCTLPFWRAWIMWNGDMIMCCVDQERTNLLGNCSDVSVKEVWNNPGYQDLRRRWRTKELEGLLCNDCKGT